MPDYSSLLDPRCIVLDLKGKKKKEILEELVGLLKSSDKIFDADEIVEELLDRERIGSTGIGKGIALPHKLIHGLQNPLVVFGRKKRGVNYDALDKVPVKLFFLILGSEGAQGEHLKLLSKLARFLHNEQFIENLLKAKTPEDVLEIFIREEGR